jgi:putative membrane protein
MKPPLPKSSTTALITVSLGLLFATGCATHHPSGTGASASASATVSGSSTVTATDSDFARQACQTGVAEVEIGRLAMQNTRNSAIRRFARTLSRDHARAEQELAALFERKGISPEAELAHDFQGSLQRLAGLKGGAFDAAFKEQVIADHENAIALFERQAGEGADADLRAFAQKRLPQLREHMETARALPVSSDVDGPVASPGVNTVLQNQAIRTVPFR